MSFKFTPIQTKWIAALRSGKYPQGKSKLCQINNGVRRYCCLGVGCMVINEDEPGAIDETSSIYGIAFDKSTHCMPIKAQSILGLHDSCGCANDGNAPLSALNDNLNKTLPEIADILETKPESYFKSNDSI